MAGTITLFHQFVDDLAAGVHDAALNADTDTLKLALSNTAPTAASDATLSDITQISAGNGYTAGGIDALNAATASGGVISVAASGTLSWTASSGDIGPFRYVVLYNDTPSSPTDPLIGYWDLGSGVTVTDGDDFTFDPVSNLLQIG